MTEMPALAVPTRPGWAEHAPGPDMIAHLVVDTEYGSDYTPTDAEVDAAGVSAFERLERVAAWERAIAWMHAQQQAELVALTEHARSRPPVGWSSADAVESVHAEIALILTLSCSAAAARCADANTLVGEFPATYALLRTGELTVQKARIITDGCAELSEADAARVEAAVLPKARGQTPGRLRDAVRRAIARVDADALTRRRAKRVRERKVVLYPERDGLASIVATLPAAEAVGVYAVLDDHARRAGAADPRSMDARRADVFTDLVLDGAGFRSAGTTTAGGAGDGDELVWVGSALGTAVAAPTGNGVQVQIRVTIPFDTLVGASHLPAELAGYGPLPADQARALAFAPDSVWWRLLTDPATGALVEHGTTRYRPPPALAEHVYARHRTCQFPGCRVPAHRCDLDHNVPHDQGGATNGPNLGPKCRPHHRLRGRPGWEVVQYPDGTIDWTTPSGHVYRVEPPPIAPVAAVPEDHEPAPF